MAIVVDSWPRRWMGIAVCARLVEKTLPSYSALAREQLIGIAETRRWAIIVGSWPRRCPGIVVSARSIAKVFACAHYSSPFLVASSS